MMLVAPLVEVEESDLRRILDVNVLGIYRVAKAAFPLIHQRRKRVITISSETGWQKALMLNGPYAMTKHAVEAYSDALRRELMFLDVPVSIIQPDPFRTAMVDAIESAFQRAESVSEYFPELIRRVGELAALEQGRSHPPELLAEVVWKAATATRPKTRYSVRPDLRRTILHRLPDRLADFAVKRMLQKA